MIRTAVDVVGLLSFGIKTAGRPDRERHWSVDGAAGKVPPGSRSWPQQLLDTAQDWRNRKATLVRVTAAIVKGNIHQIPAIHVQQL